jgi:hypothetical protein
MLVAVGRAAARGGKSECGARGWLAGVLFGLFRPGTFSVVMENAFLAFVATVS